MLVESMIEGGLGSIDSSILVARSAAGWDKALGGSSEGE